MPWISSIETGYCAHRRHCEEIQVKVMNDKCRGMICNYKDEGNHTSELITLTSCFTKANHSHSPLGELEETMAVASEILPKAHGSRYSSIR